jgi:Stress responsive A/B Barrel Domain
MTRSPTADGTKNRNKHLHPPLPFMAFLLKIPTMKMILPITAVLLGLLTCGSTQKTSAADHILRHVVLFKFKNGTTPAQVKQVEDAFRALPGKIKLVKDFEWGTNVSPENLAQGYTHCFFLTFSSDKDRDAYLVDPAHKEFGAILKPYIDKVLVVDFWAKH